MANHGCLVVCSTFCVSVVYWWHNKESQAAPSMSHASLGSHRLAGEGSHGHYGLAAVARHRVPLGWSTGSAVQSHMYGVCKHGLGCLCYNAQLPVLGTVECVLCLCGRAAACQLIGQDRQVGAAVKVSKQCTSN